MAMTFAKTVSVGVHKFKDESDLDKKVLAAEELLDNAARLRKHTTRFIRIAWILGIIPLLLASLTFNSVPWYIYEVEFPSGGIIPPELRQIIAPIAQSDGITDEVKQWIFCIAALLALPIVFRIILSIVCKSALAPAREAKVQASKSSAMSIDEKLSHIRDVLSGVRYKMDSSEAIPEQATGVLLVIFLIPFLSILTYENSILVHGAVLLAAVLIFALEQCTLQLFFSNRKCKRQAKKLYDEFDRQRSEYAAKYKEEKRQREEEEQRRREAELERKRLADLKEGEELYKKATMGEAIDERLMAQAAEKGNPQAGLYVGKQMLQDMKGLTTKEIVALCNKAKKYFKAASDANIPDGIFLYAYIQSMTESHNEDDWTAILRRVRALRKEDLSENLRGLYDMTVEQLVDVANSAAESAAARRREYQAQKARQEAEDRALWEEILRRPCKYSNGHYCTLKSTASSLYPCTGDGKGRNFCVDYAK